ncbi:sugar phosphate isomerase/epimerase [Paenibacillus hunanensis]|uniref:sugar phosphate isomerase/epimerase family protein n=1 Tax=Paenibacillus hunanensis TaxID=539262 RepID=UPI002026FC5E|nr:sugar phosphate isomerase/epimerase family protein [Paenibacillus hunanensis]MCL9662834.1 sugar phosphate isomerase/epimerase [Paenibacillus hunanensis]
MKLSISNIAWNIEDDAAIIDILKQYNMNGIEVAPTKIWDYPLSATSEQAIAYRKKWSAIGIRLVAMQSLLFGQSELVLFKDTSTREKLKNYLFKIIEIAEGLGTQILVFGSPKNRLVGNLNRDEQLEIAVPFFRDIGKKALEHQVLFCIEPNAKEYGCDFVTNTDEAIAVIEAVNHPGFKLHLDAAVMTLNNENYEQCLKKSIPHLAHFHVSEPFLELIGSKNTDHTSIANALRNVDYRGWVSIEMKNMLLDSDVVSVEKAIEFVTQIYK